MSQYNTVNVPCVVKICDNVCDIIIVQTKILWTPQKILSYIKISVLMILYYRSKIQNWKRCVKEEMQ